MSHPVIDLRHVTLHRGDTRILHDVSWTVSPGTCAAIFGPNGSGKSTLTRVICGYTWPSSGEVDVLGRHFGETNLHDLRQSVRLVQPGGQFDMDPALTARQVVLTGFFSSLALYHDPIPDQHAQADDLLDRVGLSPLADHPYATLSNGERVRALIARALTGQPKLLLLDEPTAGLDLLAREQVLAAVEHLFHQSDPPTVVMISHHVEELPTALSNVLLLDHGAVAASGAPAAVFESQQLSRVYRCAITVRENHGRFYAQVQPGTWKNLLK